MYVYTTYDKLTVFSDTNTISHNAQVYYILIQNSQAVKKQCGPGYGEKRCEIQGGGQEMAVMVG